MAGSSLDIIVDQGDLGQQLQRLADRAADLHDALGEIGEIVSASTQARFGQGLDPSGTPWAPLAASTLARKKGPGTLRESLHLQGSIRYQVEGEAVCVGTDVPYAAAHQFGTPARVIRPRHGKALAWPGAAHPVKQVNHPGLPARPFLGLSTEDENDILAVLADYLAGG